MVSFTHVKLVKLEHKSWTMTTATPCCGALLSRCHVTATVSDSEHLYSECSAHVQFQLIAPSWLATLSRSCMWFSGIQRCKLVSWRQDAIFAASKERSLVQRWNFGGGDHLGGKSLPRGAFSRKWARKLTDSLCWVQMESVLCSVICAISRISQHLCVSP